VGSLTSWMIAVATAFSIAHLKKKKKKKGYYGLILTVAPHAG
jgi:hypothetical protein